jgi:hypothetical protein
MNIEKETDGLIIQKDLGCLSAIGITLIVVFILSMFTHYDNTIIDLQKRIGQLEVEVQQLKQNR